MGSKQVEEVVSLEVFRSKRFLDRLRRRPFVALVFEEDHVHVYHKGIPDESARKIQALAEVLTESED